jgi:Fuc2NAc and GlcNAc transferase
MVSGREMSEALIFLFTLAISYFGVEKFRQWSLRKEIFDMPNERSSHRAPTPRGGGLIFVVMAITFFAVNGVFSADGNFRWSYLFGAVAVAFVSWLDDLYSVKTFQRFIVHGLAAGAVVYAVGYWHQVDLPYVGTIEFGAAGAFLTFCWIVGLTNAYNFMDGIDGIAATQAVTAGIGWLIAGKLLGSGETAVYAGVIAFACLGFWLHNKQPAKIFMGDVGSAFLGYTFAVLPLLAETEKASNAERDAIFPLIGVTLVWFFVFDAVYTFIRRLVKKEKVWEAHRGHLYQKMVIGGLAHRTVTKIYGAFSLILLFFTVAAPLTDGKSLIAAAAFACALSALLVYLSRRTFAPPIGR